MLQTELKMDAIIEFCFPWPVSEGIIILKLIHIPLRGIKNEVSLIINVKGTVPQISPNVDGWKWLLNWIKFKKITT